MKTFEGKFNKDSKGVFAISLVNQPATEETFIAMSKQEKAITLSKVDEEQKILMGLVLQPNQMIPRVDESGNEYQMYFSAETIKAYSENFFKSGFQLNSKLEHETPIEGVTFVESWIVENPKVDKSYNFGMEYPKGSWIATMKVDNEDIWNNYVKTGELQGFSIDAMVELEEVKEEVNFKSNINMSKENKSILSKIKELVMSTEVVDAEVLTFGSVKSDDLDIQFEGETLEVGSSVYLMDGEEKVALADGEYVLETGETLVVKEGVAESMDAKSEEEAAPESEEEVKELADEDKKEEEEEEEVKAEEPEEKEEEKEEVKELEEVVEETPEEEAPAMMTEEDVRRIVEEMIMGFKSEVESLRSENTELKSEVVSLSKTPVAAPIASTPTQMSAHSHILDAIKRRK
tara:strand:- start:775 stop:1986 length:1212 start_codon:yes stop_codon:yes gene_type:complete